MTNKKAYIAGTIYSGTDTLRHHAVLVSEGKIEALVPAITVSGEYEKESFGEEAFIAPAFIDLQLYGANKRLLSLYPDAVTVGEIAKHSREGGAAWCMPTVATNPYDTIFKCIDAIRDYWKQGGKGVLGLHVEGPWISPEQKGAHNPEWIFSPTVEQAKQLLDYGKDVIKIITLAPEVCSAEVLKTVQSYDVIISAGHSNIVYEEATQLFTDDVIDAATHLYNAMSPLHHRKPGLVGAVLNHSIVKSSIIPDGIHVAFAAVRIAKKLLGERLFAITDSVTETTEGWYQHKFEGDRYTANGILSGSALTMHKAFVNLVKEAGLPIEEALRMCSYYPARVVLQSDEIGMLRKGYPADMVALDKDLNLLTVISALAEPIQPD